MNIFYLSPVVIFVGFMYFLPSFIVKSYLHRLGRVEEALDRFLLFGFGGYLICVSLLYVFFRKRKISFINLILLIIFMAVWVANTYYWFIPKAVSLVNWMELK